jgi:hypothetical protein
MAKKEPHGALNDFRDSGELSAGFQNLRDHVPSGELHAPYHAAFAELNKVFVSNFPGVNAAPLTKAAQVTGRILRKKQFRVTLEKSGLTLHFRDDTGKTRTAPVLTESRKGFQTGRVSLDQRSFQWHTLWAAVSVFPIGGVDLPRGKHDGKRHGAGHRSRLLWSVRTAMRHISRGGVLACPAIG